MSKINIMFCPSDTFGVGHFRSIWPAQALKKHHGDKYNVKVTMNPKLDIEYLSQFDIIHFHRALGPYEQSEQFWGELKKRGVTLICDIDDYWSPPSTHPLYSVIINDKLDEKIKRNLELADIVTTTTEIFADRIRKESTQQNVYVIPNAVNLSEKMWKSEVEPNPTDKVRISWIGGSSHLHDLELLRPSLTKLNNSPMYQEKYQFIVCGFDTRGTITEIHPNGEKKVRKIEPHESVWVNFEKIFTSDYKLTRDSNPEYDDWLRKIKNEEYPDLYSQSYVRRWTLPLTKYGYHYDYCDVCLAPIAETVRHQDQKGTVRNVEHTFNLVKSELKIIESGIKKKVLIAQDFGIYKELLEHGKTGLLVSDNKKGWLKAIKQVIDNPELREEMAQNLHDWVMERYTLETVTDTRASIYDEILAKKTIEA